MRYVWLGGRAKWAIAALVATVVADIVAIVLDWQRYDLFRRIASGGSFTLNEVSRSDDRNFLIAVVQLGILAVAAILFIRWFHRAYRNVDPLDGHRRYGSGWAIGGWFVPILNLWRPKQIANDIWRESDPQRRPDSADLGIVTLWWILFLAANWTTWVGGRIALGGNTVRDFRNAAAAYLVGDLLDVLAALVAIIVIRQITIRQEARATTAVPGVEAASA